MSIEQLVHLCQSVGRHVPLWTQGPGSNISCKVAEENRLKLFIKASGMRLDQISSATGIAAIQCTILQEHLMRMAQKPGTTDSEYDLCVKSCLLQDFQHAAPSMEAGFHAVLPAKFILHFHSLPAILMAYEYFNKNTRVKDWLELEWLDPVCFLEQLRPGWFLTKSIINTPKCSLYILKNHGVILAHNDAYILNKWQLIENKFCKAFGYGLLLDFFDDNNIVQTAQQLFNKPTPLRLYFPDAVVFLEKIKRILRPARDAHGERYYLLKDSAIAEDQNAAEIWLAIQALWRVCPELDAITPSLVDEIIDLPSEKLRQTLWSDLKSGRGET